jgi:hypothetical protein
MLSTQFSSKTTTNTHTFNKIQDMTKFNTMAHNMLRQNKIKGKLQTDVEIEILLFEFS